MAGTRNKPSDPAPTAPVLPDLPEGCDDGDDSDAASYVDPSLIAAITPHMVNRQLGLVMWLPVYRDTDSLGGNSAYDHKVAATKWLRDNGIELPDGTVLGGTSRAAHNTKNPTQTDGFRIGLVRKNPRKSRD